MEYIRGSILVDSDISHQLPLRSVISLSEYSLLVICHPVVVVVVVVGGNGDGRSYLNLLMYCLQHIENTTQN